MKKQIVFCTMGAIFEWYEFTIFVSLTPILSTLFFPQSSHFAAMISTFAIFASGFLTRPLGALFFGHIGDTLGRKYSLLITIFAMAVSTACIGLIPVGSSISTMVLVICRLAQGFFTSGEYPGGIALLAEQASPKHRSFAISFGVFGSGVGGAAGALIYLLLLKIIGYDNMLAWGWRIPFLMALPLGWISYGLRKTILESFEFQQLKQKKLTSTMPILELFTQHRKTIFAALGISMLSNIAVYTHYTSRCEV